MRFFRWLAYLVVTLVLLIAVLFIAARFADGPVGIIPGGALTGGELVAEANVDWTAFADENVIELQLLEPERSRTVWMAVHEGTMYVPVSLEFPPGKTWHLEALEDGRAIVRVRGKRYERSAVKVTDTAEFDAVLPILAAKYSQSGDVLSARESVWLFRMEPRSGGAR